MPNHVYTNLEVTGSEADISAFKAKFCETIDGQENCLVFNRVIPMPESLQVECGSRSSTGYAIIAGDYKPLFEYPWLKELMSKDSLTPEKINHMQSSREDFIAWFTQHQPETIEIGKTVVANKETYGYQTWYEWSIANWGTKWDAYNHSVGESATHPYVTDHSYVTYFETAWSPAIPVLEAMSEAFPNLSFRMPYADEGGGFAGVAHAEDGVVTDVDEDWRTICIHEFGFDASEFDEEDEDEDSGVESVPSTTDSNVKVS